MKLLTRWLVTAAAVAAAVYLLPDIRLEGGIGNLLIVALLVGFVNSIVGPIVRWLACGAIVLTLGLFLLVINAVLLLVAAWLARQVGIAFFVDGFVAALLGSVIISVVSFVLSVVLADGDD